MLKQLSVFEDATDMVALNAAKDDDNSDSKAAVVEMAEKDGELTTEKTLEHPPTVTVLSREQALQLLKPGRGKGRKPRRTSSQDKDDSLEGKFVNLVDLLLPVPAKGEFDVNKIKSSLYFFS
jgi:DNA-directed RNA polymerase